MENSDSPFGIRYLGASSLARKSRGLHGYVDRENVSRRRKGSGKHFLKGSLNRASARLKNKSTNSKAGSSCEDPRVQVTRNQTNQEANQW
jgi:hypothetical protein